MRKRGEFKKMKSCKRFIMGLLCCSLLFTTAACSEDVGDDTEESKVFVRKFSDYTFEATYLPESEVEEDFILIDEDFHEVLESGTYNYADIEYYLINGDIYYRKEAFLNIKEMLIGNLYGDRKAIFSSFEYLKYFENLEELEIWWGSKVESLEGIQYLTKLKKLDLNSTELDDITLLKELDSLEYLDIRFNNITDISPLARLSNLETLLIDDNPIGDLTSLLSMTGVEYFSFTEESLSPEALEEFYNVKNPHTIEEVRFDQFGNEKYLFKIYGSYSQLGSCFTGEELEIIDAKGGKSIQMIDLRPLSNWRRGDGKNFGIMLDIWKDDIISWRDVNWDGQPDFFLTDTFLQENEKWPWALPGDGYTYYYWQFEPQTGCFEEAQLNAFGYKPEFDDENQQVVFNTTSYQPFATIKEIYEYDEGTLKLQEKTTRTLIDVQAVPYDTAITFSKKAAELGWHETETYYLSMLEREERVDGQMVEVENNYILVLGGEGEGTQSSIDVDSFPIKSSKGRKIAKWIEKNKSDD